MGVSGTCEPCEPCEPYKTKLLERPSQPLCRRPHPQEAEAGDPFLQSLHSEGSQLHKVHNSHEIPILRAFLCEPSCGQKVHHAAAHVQAR
jgi:hypothetical protein